MKKILIAMSVAILMALCSAPSIVKASEYAIGSVLYTRYNNDGELLTIYASSEGPFDYARNSSGIFDLHNYGKPTIYHNNSPEYLYLSYAQSVYIENLQNDSDISYSNRIIPIYSDYEDFEDNLPPEFQRTTSEKLWDAFYDFYEMIFGYRPMPGSIYDLLRNGSDGEEVEITFPTLTPTPSPIPTPTPIPVQTIFVPDGNGNTTIIYQYPDPTTGVITQSPYNPNIQNDITINCDCDDDGCGSGTFTNNPTDPYTLDASLLWADGFGVQMSENPLTTVNQQQTTLKEAAMEYDEAVNVASNSFNVLPLKWIALCGLAGGILIIAGLIRTFLGG